MNFLKAGIPAIRRTLLSGLVLGLTSVVAPSLALAQEEEGRAHYRSPLLAAVIAVPLPTAGHAYAGEPERGLLIAAAAVAGAVVFVSGWAASDDCNPSVCNSPGGQWRLRVGTAIIAGAYLFNVVDAPLAARRQNRARATSFARSVEPALVLTPDRAGGVQLRIAVGR